MDGVHIIEGQLGAVQGAKFALVATRFNDLIVDRLVGGAQDALLRHGVPASSMTLVRVPGAWELPVACAQIAREKQASAIVALGAVIRGATPHFDVVVDGATRGLAQISLETGIPVTLGLLTTDTIEQAVERAGTKAGNKGFDAAMSALEMVSLQERLSKASR